MYLGGVFSHSAFEYSSISVPLNPNLPSNHILRLVLYVVLCFLVLVFNFNTLVVFQFLLVPLIYNRVNKIFKI